MSDNTIVMRTPAKRHVDIVLAAIAGALLILVILTARGALSGPESPAASPIASPLATTLPTATPLPTVAPQRQEDHGGKGRG